MNYPITAPALNANTNVFGGQVLANQVRGGWLSGKIPPTSVRAKVFRRNDEHPPTAPADAVSGTINSTNYPTPNYVFESAIPGAVGNAVGNEDNKVVVWIDYPTGGMTLGHEIETREFKGVSQM